MVTADIVRDHTGVLQVNGVDIHADGKGADRLIQHFLGNGADQGGIQTAGEQETDRGVRVQALFNAVHQQAAQLGTDFRFSFHGEISHISRIRILDEFTVNPVVSGREGKDCIAHTDQVFRLAGKSHAASPDFTVIEGTDTDGIPGGDQFLLFVIPEDQGKLRVQGFEHFHTVFPIKGKQDLTVAFAFNIVGFHEAGPQGTEAVKLAVADHVVIIQPERLHTFLVQAHDGQTVKTENAAGNIHHAAHIRTAGDGPVKTGFDQVPGKPGTCHAED